MTFPKKPDPIFPVLKYNSIEPSHSKGGMV